MNFYYLLLAVVFTSLGTQSYAQLDSATLFTQADTIQYVKRTERFYLGGKKINTLSLKPLLMQFPSSAVEFRQYQKRATPGTIILLTGITAGVIALTRIKKDDFINPYTITLFAGDIIGIPLMIAAKKRLRKSASLYNREILGY